MAAGEIGPMGQRLADAMVDKVVETIESVPASTLDEKKAIRDYVASTLADAEIRQGTDEAE
jgi:hypothetical protein